MRKGRIVSIDLGARLCGVADWTDGQLMRVATVRGPTPANPLKMAAEVRQWIADGGARDGYPWPHVVVEWPIILGHFTVAAEDIRGLQQVGHLIGFDSDFTPFQWKGNTPKGIHHKRVLHALTDPERAMMVGMDHNAKDAVGIGLVAVGRTGRGGVPL